MYSSARLTRHLSRFPVQPAFFLFLTIGGVTAVSACTNQTQPELAPIAPVTIAMLDTSRSARGDAPWAKLALEIPGGFAGFYLGDNGKLVLLLTDPEKKHEAIEALSARQPAVLPPGTDLNDATIKRVRWNFAQLYDWLRYLGSKNLGGRVITVDLDEVHNRIAFGVLKSDVATVRANIKKLRLPKGLVSVQAQPPIILD